MIELLIGLLLAISTHTACDMGKPANYYKWVDAHPDYTVPMTLHTDANEDYWLMSDGQEYYLFKFIQPIEDTIDTGASHGACFRDVGAVK